MLRNCSRTHFEYLFFCIIKKKANLIVSNTFLPPFCVYLKIENVRPIDHERYPFKVRERNIEIPTS